MTERDDDLAERVAELEDALADLRTELREPPRGPLGLPRPPTPRELLRFTERRAIPAAIAALEANVRALELLRGALRLTDPERAARDGATETRDRAERAGRAVMDRLDGALSDLQAEMAEGDLPADGEAREILRDARRLTGEIDDRLGARGDGVSARDESTAGARGTDGTVGERGGDDSTAGDGPSPGGEATTGDGSTAGATDEDDSAAVEIDVEGELQSIKDELDDGDGDSGGEDGDSGGDGGSGADGEPGTDDEPGPDGDSAADGDDEGDANADDGEERD